VPPQYGSDCAAVLGFTPSVAASSLSSNSIWPAPTPGLAKSLSSVLLDDPRRQATSVSTCPKWQRRPTRYLLRPTYLQDMQFQPAILARRSMVSIAASAIIGSACLVIISNDASAYSSSGIPIFQPGVYRGGLYRGGYYRGGYYRGVARGVAAGAAGAYYAPRCRYYPYGRPCY
jgi:hypothetical protein